ncbi:MAG: NCS1 family nucleobase:cation symporter-1 [Bacteroidia bacterium]
MNKEIIELNEDLSSSSLYSEDLAPVPKAKRTWNTWHLAALWVGMAVCIPTYLLASYMIKSGLNWVEALLIIGLANLIITIPMVLNGHAGVKYGIPFPVIGRASFGTKGIHIASIVRGIVACGWFGVQTWIGGLAIYAIFNAATGNVASSELSIGQFICFFIFWIINMYFIWKGTESIKWLEVYSAPILIGMGIILIGWGAYKADGFGIVLKQSTQLEKPTAVISQTESGAFIQINPITDLKGNPKASEYQITLNGKSLGWEKIVSNKIPIQQLNNDSYQIQLRNEKHTSSLVPVPLDEKKSSTSKLWSYILWLTAMVGFWATMSLSIADITRYATSQKSQVAGQFIGLPGTMMLYSFVGIFVTCAAVINFDDILIASDAPWDPVSLLARFESPTVVIISQIFMLIATLSTNIAANVIAPANAFSNLIPKKISFRTGGFITGIIGIIICPWLLMDEISSILIFISGLLGPVLGILLSDYFLVRKKNIVLVELFKENGIYAYSSGFNSAAILSLIAGISVALIGFWIKELEFLYSLSWFTGFTISFFLYYFLMKRTRLLGIK